MVTTYSPSRFGQDSGLGASGGAQEELFLKIFAGEVLLSFERHAVTNGKVNTRSIAFGKSATFPVIGAASASFHTPGSSLITETAPQYKSTPKSAEKVISIDGILQSSVMIADIDEAMSHFGVRGPYARELGWALAREFDVHTLQTIIVGSEKDPTFTGDKSDWGSTQTRSIVALNFSDVLGGTKTDTAVTAVFKDVAEAMDKDDVPEHGRHFAVEPDTYHYLAQMNDVLSSDYSSRGTGGDRAIGGSAPMLMYNGFSIWKTNRLSDIRSLGSSTYSVPHAEQLGTDYVSKEFDHIHGVAWQQDQAVGVVKLKELGLQSEYLLEFLGTLMVAGFSCGHGVLKESACYSIRNAT